MAALTGGKRDLSGPSAKQPIFFTKMHGIFSKPTSKPYFEQKAQCPMVMKWETGETIKNNNKIEANWQAPPCILNLQGAKAPLTIEFKEKAGYCKST